MITRIIISAVVPIFVLVIISLMLMATSHHSALIPPRGELANTPAPAYAAKIIEKYGSQYSEECFEFIEYEAEAKSLLFIEIYNIGIIENFLEKIYYYFIPENIKKIFKFDPSIGLGQIKISNFIKYNLTYSDKNFYKYCDSLVLVSRIVKKIYLINRNEKYLVEIYNGQHGNNIENKMYLSIFSELRNTFR